MSSTSRAVIRAPAIAPRVPPTAMNPKSRLALSRPNPSAMKAQNSETANMLKTEIHT